MKQIAFPSWVLPVVSLIVVLNLMAFGVGLVVIYIVDEYVTPAFSEQSYPPPRPY